MGAGGSIESFTKVHNTCEDNLAVFEDATDICERDLSLYGASALIDSEPGLHIAALGRGEPFGVFRKVGNGEEENKGDDAGAAGIHIVSRVERA